MSDSDSASTGETSDTSAPDASGDAPGSEAVPPDEAVEPTLGERYEELERQYQAARELLEDYNRKAVTFIRDHPGICIAGALGTGYLLGRLASRRWLK